VATSDFVSDTPSVQLEEEAIEAEVSRLSSGAELHGIHGSELVISAHEEVLGAVGHRVMEPFRIRHLDKLTLSREAPPGIEMLVGEDRERMRRRWRGFSRRVREEGYTRPATIFIEGMRS
ncbi:MAG: hypothetical protein ACRDSJ_14830, partial [Rubrobacteraceae bacterium]